MESLSDNWAAVDGDDMVSGETDKVCSEWVCCGFGNSFFFFFFLTVIFACFPLFSHQIMSALRKHVSPRSCVFKKKIQPTRATQES